VILLSQPVLALQIKVGGRLGITELSGPAIWC